MNSAPSPRATIPGSSRNCQYATTPMNIAPHSAPTASVRARPRGVYFSYSVSVRTCPFDAVVKGIAATNSSSKANVAISCDHWKGWLKK
jgi:hypothetical protein